MNEGSLKQKIVENINSVDSILVTVSQNPSVDELAAALALTMFLNDLDKHATAVVSGAVPQSMNFLKPEKTFENSIDSLRDFVISLDKEKADHLRYKVDGDVVKIFITPYRTIISDKDLDYSQGDYNVEMVIAIGVTDQDHLDKALSAHGKILHDAVVATIGLDSSKLGSLDYNDSTASSLSELVAGVASALATDDKKISEQVASALLTGVVSATERFSNDKTTSKVMTVAADLMAAGANQQLIASKLREGSKLPISAEGSKDGSERISKGKSSGENSSSSSKNRKNKNRGLNIEHTEVTPVETANKANDDSDATSAKQNPINKTEAAAIFDAALDKASQELPAPETPDPVVSAPETLATPAPDQSTDEEKLSQQLEDANTPIASSQISNLDEQLQQENKTAPAEDSSSADAKPFEFIPAPVGEPSTDDNVSQSIGISDQRSTVDEKDAPEPSFGGVLNATTEQAADDKRILKEESRNKTILSHGGGGYVGNTNASFDTSVSGSQDPKEPEPVDIFSQQPSQTVGPEAVPAPTMPSFEPPTPPTDAQGLQPAEYTSQQTSSSPTLEDIDQFNRQKPDPDSALQAVEDIYNTTPEQTPPPIVTPSIQAMQQQGIPPLPDVSQDMNYAQQPPSFPTPPPPPAPFENNLAPMTGGMPNFTQEPQASQEQLPPDNLGQILPPTPQVPQQPPRPSDPGQFKLPGQ